MKLFRKNNGTVTVLCAVTGIVLITALFFSINSGKYFYDRNYTDRASDSIALSLATWEARGLNTISQLNLGMKKSIELIRIILFLWAASIGLALSGHPSLFFRLTKRGPKTIKSLWQEGVKLSKIAKKTRNSTPLLVTACLVKLLSIFDIKGIIYPSIPDSSCRNKNSLCLHLIEGKELTITGPLNSAREKAGSIKTGNIFKKKLLKILKKIFFTAMKTLFALKGKIIPLVPDKDFQKKQVIYFIGYKGAIKPFMKSLFRELYSVHAISSAAPYGGSKFNPTWKSRLITPDTDMKENLYKAKK